MSTKELPVNEQIRAPLIVLITATGENKGEFSKFHAIQMAKAEGLDLVQVAPGSDGNPPVCKIADFGKMKFDASKVQKKKGHQPSVKEIQFGVDIQQHDLDIKLRKTSEFLEKGHRVVMTLMMKGRAKYTDKTHEIARAKMAEVLKTLGPKVVATPQKESLANITVTLSPA